MFVKYKMAGFEPEKVAALNKQSGGLFVASESLSESESQLVCKAKPKQTGIPRPEIPHNLSFYEKYL